METPTNNGNAPEPSSLPAEPADDLVEDFAKSEREDIRTQDHAMYHEWKATPTKSNLGRLVNRFMPAIRSEVNRQMGSLPAEALTAEARKWAIHAVKTYDPSKGASLNTHVVTWLQKTRRANYQTQNAARLSEKQQRQFGEYNTGLQDLTSQLAREPTVQELAGHLGWTARQIKKMQAELTNDLHESGSEFNPTFKTFDNEQIRHQYVMSQLTPDEVKLFEMVGTNEKMSVPEMATRLGVNVNRFHYLKKKLVTKIQELQENIGRNL